MKETDKITVKDLYWFNKRLYELFESLVRNRRSYEPKERLDILNNFFITFKYPKLSEFGSNIEAHEGEGGPDEANHFIAYSYEMFLKETDDELYNIFLNAEDIYCSQYQIIPILQKTGCPIVEPEEWDDVTIKFFDNDTVPRESLTDDCELPF